VIFVLFSQVAHGCPCHLKALNKLTALKTGLRRWG